MMNTSDIEIKYFRQLSWVFRISRGNRLCVLKATTQPLRGEHPTFCVNFRQLLLLNTLKPQYRRIWKPRIKIDVTARDSPASRICGSFDGEPFLSITPA